MIDRRTFMLASLAAALMPGTVTAGMRANKPLSWTDFHSKMKQLASAYADRTITQRDIAMLSPDDGNIHALRAHSKTCSMLDYFIPPYERSERTWFQPVAADWFGKMHITCRCIHENDFYLS
jgi:hypothetical protein